MYTDSKTDNIHFWKHDVSCWVSKLELKAVRCHFHVRGNDVTNSFLIHIILGEASFDVATYGHQ